MNILQQQRNLYLLFIGIVTLSAVSTVWNNYQEHQLRKLRKKEIEDNLTHLK